MPSKVIPEGWRRLNVAIIGGGIGGMSAGIALRRAGHEVTIYEGKDFAGEVGASVSCAANGTRWLEEWNVDIAKGDPVVLEQLINRDWKTGEPVSVYSLEDYKSKWGYVYNMPFAKSTRQQESSSLQTASLLATTWSLAPTASVPWYAKKSDSTLTGARPSRAVCTATS
jgi:2-polyprenyl-6-methoxyphenol hydroxylase-like FAD-dependent oxidoreductase